MGEKFAKYSIIIFYMLTDNIIEYDFVHIFDDWIRIGDKKQNSYYIQRFWM